MPQAIIMAGGPGERFWPLTHKKFPKYRIRFDGKHSLLQNTYRRLLKVYHPDQIHLVTTREHIPMIRKELPLLKKRNLICEPRRKNTAPALFLSSAVLAERFGPEEVVSFFPADHLIQNETLFKKTIQGAIALAKKEERIVTIGIKPHFPATGFGYIERGSAIAGFSQAYRVRRFVEKPDRPTALQYLRRKNFYWNGGIFTWRIGVFINAMKRFSPGISRRFDLKKLAESYRRLPAISIDYALLEKAKNIALYKTEMDWCDIGSWDMFLEKAKKNAQQNFVSGACIQKECRRSLILNLSPAPLIAIGISGLIVAQTKQGTLVCPRGRSEEAALLFKAPLK